MELLDALQIRAVNQRSGLTLTEAPTLFTELHGSEGACREDLLSFRSIAADCQATSFVSATDDEGRRALWRARHDAFWAVKSLWPGKEVLVTDVAVPLSHLAAAIRETEADIASSGLIAPILGHVGDGNFHCIIVFDPSDRALSHTIEGFLDRLVARALRFEGTATGEHGVGQGKKRFMVVEHGGAIDVMRDLKSALDPLGILNPGKIF
jgi:FAD/FMN-containing dehydrogenase